MVHHRLELLAQVRKSARYCRDEAIRRKIGLFLKVLELGVLKGCKEEKIYPPFYYYWWKRYQESGFKIEALQEKSRRPKRSPKKTDPKIVQWIRRHRKQNPGSLEKIQLELLRDQKVRISKSTVYRIHLREGLPMKRKKSRPALPSFSSFVKQEKGIVTEAPKAVFADRYRLDKELGRGGGGVVYLASDLKAENKKVALKRVEWANHQYPQLIDSLKNEFATLAALRHRNLAQVYDFGKTNREIYFTSERIEGQDILAAAQKANLNTVFQLLVQTLGALDFLHRRGVLHLDLKPANILVTDPNRTGDLTVKLIDFGTALWPKKGGSLEGEFVGTPPYAAPEMIRGEGPTPSCDLYSLGMILHQIFAGRFPFENQEPLELMKEQVYGQPLRMTNLNPALPETFSDLLLKMAAKNPKDRFQSVQEILEAINECLGENFSLRGENAPLKILEDSDFMFHPEIVERLTRIFLRKEGGVTMLSGALGIGKSRVVKALKEVLQLQGIHPILLEKKEALDDLLKTENEVPSGPLLIDGPDLTREEMVSLLDLLENLSVPVLLTTEHSPVLELNPSEWIQLSLLRAESISPFLQYEIREFPASLYRQPLADQSRGLPSQLESFLQIMKEEGWIQWTDQGWCWTGREETPELSEILFKSEAQWEGRKDEVMQILKFSRIALNTRTLEGMLGLEPGSLAEKLVQWVSEGEIFHKNIKETPHYFSKETASKERDRWRHDWGWAEKELEILYEQGSFLRGVQFADFLETEAGKEEIPEAVALLSARHSVAAGFPEKALKRLPRNAALAPRSSGLYHEIQGRAHLSLGDDPRAEACLIQAEKSFQLSQDLKGLSRVYNLMGSQRRRVHDPSQAEDYFSKAISFAQEAKAAYLQGLAQMNLAIFYQDQGDFSRAQAVYETTFPLEQEAKHPHFSCRLKDNWVNFLFYTGRSLEAETACYDLLKTAIRYQMTEPQAAAFSYFALLAGQKNQRELQLNYMNRALGLIGPQEQPQLYLQCLIDRGYTYLNLKKFVPAQLDAELALHIAQKRTHSIFVGLASLLLGKILRDRPHPDLSASTRFLNDAHRLFYQNQIRQHLWQVEFDRGLLAKKRGEALRARNYFLSAQKELEAYLPQLPETFRQNFLRDRKQERIVEELKALEIPPISS